MGVCDGCGKWKKVTRIDGELIKMDLCDTCLPIECNQCTSCDEWFDYELSKGGHCRECVTHFAAQKKEAVTV